MGSLYFHALLAALFIFLVIYDLDLTNEASARPRTLSLDLVLVPNTGESEQSGESRRQGDLAGVDKDKWGELIERLDDSRSLKGYEDTFEKIIPNSGVSESYIGRERHYEDITVKEVFPTLSTIDKPFEEIIEQAPEALSDHLERNEVIQKYREWRAGEIQEERIQIRRTEYSGQSGRAPLNFPEEERKEYFDRTLTKTKEEQLKNFVGSFMDHDPDKGDLPIAVRELYYENLQRIAYSFSGDPTYFYLDYYEENLNKEDFLKHSLYQVSRLKGSKTMTEMLFSLHDIYEIQQNAMNMYLQFRTMYSGLPPEKREQLHIETLHRVDERYKKLVEEKNITNRDEVTELYTSKRLEIIDFLIQNTPGGYRLDDALYEKARIHWERGMLLNRPEELELAVNEWLDLYSRAGLSRFDGEDAPAPGDDLSTEEESGETDAFMNRKALLQMKSYLDEYLDADDALRMQLRYKIHSLIDLRRRDSFMEKREREERLLWPK